MGRAVVSQFELWRFKSARSSPSAAIFFSSTSWFPMMILVFMYNTISRQITAN